jgi:hypothetical protein
MSDLADLVDEHRAPVASRVLIRAEHEVVEEQLSAPLEQLRQRGLAGRTVEDVVLVDADHRQPSALGRERVPRPGGVLFLGKELLIRCLPLRRGYDRGKLKVHGVLSIIALNGIRERELA